MKREQRRHKNYLCSLVSFFFSTIAWFRMTLLGLAENIPSHSRSSGFFRCRFVNSGRGAPERRTVLESTIRTESLRGVIAAQALPESPWLRASECLLFRRFANSSCRETTFLFLAAYRRTLVYGSLCMRGVWKLGGGCSIIRERILWLNRDSWFLIRN